MIKNNRVIKTTIFVVFLFVVLFLPILNKTGVIFVQAAYQQCTEVNLKGEFKNDWGKMCNILVGVHANENFYRVSGGQNIGIDHSADCINLKNTYGKSITATMLSEAISKVCPTNNVNYTKFNESQKTALTNLCNYCLDPSKYADIFHNTQSLAVPTEQEYQQQAESTSPGGTGEKTGSVVSTEEGPCNLPTEGWSANPFDWIVGGVVYGLFIIVRGLLTLCLKMFQFLLNPVNFNGYIHFLNSSIVEALWKDFKNLANLGIIFGMIMTAVATILRIEKYSWKKMLPKLLLVALLVNFSLIISGIFVDISNFISISAASKFGNATISTIIVDQTICPVVQAFFLLKEGGGWPLLRASSLGLVLSSIFLFIFIGLTTYVFSRIITIIICLITSPLAFLSFAIPGGEKIWDFWRQRFQQAIVVLPVLCLTLYLSLRFISILIANIQ